jgi:hypothetical protein
MLPAIRVTGGSYHFAAAGWIALVQLDNYAGGGIGGNVMLTNATADTVYFAFSDITDVAPPPPTNPITAPTAPTFTPGPGSNTVSGNIPIGPNQSIIVAQPNSALWWGASGELDVTPCEVINT